MSFLRQVSADLVVEREVVEFCTTHSVYLIGLSLLGSAILVMLYNALEKF